MSAARPTPTARAAKCASDAARHTATPDQTAAAAIESGEIHLLRFDLFGGPATLTAALADAQSLTAERPSTRAAAAALHARLCARRARLSIRPGHDGDCSTAGSRLTSAVTMGEGLT